jgi:gliding motility-associated lipoprotein GldH
MKSNPYFFLAFFVVILLSCNKNEEYYAFKHLSGGQWPRDSVIYIQFDSLRLNPPDSYQVDIEIMHNKSYPYQDLWLLIGNNLQDSILQYDTLKCRVCDQYGKWLSSGGSGMHQLSVSYKKNLRAKDSVNTYRFFIRQFMKDDPLLGIERIGVKISKAINQ